MPYTGDLRRIGVQRMVGILADGRKTGLLKVRGREGLDIYIRRGRVAQVQAVKGQALVDTLLELSTTQAEEKDAVRRLAAGDELGTALLLDFFQVSGKERSLALLREQAVASIRRTAEWQKGDIRFEPATELPDGRLDLSLSFARLTSSD